MNSHQYWRAGGGGQTPPHSHVSTVSQLLRLNTETRKTKRRERFPKHPPVLRCAQHQLAAETNRDTGVLKGGEAYDWIRDMQRGHEAQGSRMPKQRVDRERTAGRRVPRADAGEGRYLLAHG